MLSAFNVEGEREQGRSETQVPARGGSNSLDHRAAMTR